MYNSDANCVYLYVALFSINLCQLFSQTLMSYGLLIDDTLVACIAGGTVVNVVEDIISRGGDPSNMIVVCVVACPPALKQLSEKFVGETSVT